MKKAPNSKRKRAAGKRAARTSRGTVPGAGDEARVPRQWLANYRRLLVLREHLLGEREHLARATKSPVGVRSIHMADVATDEAQRDLDLSLLTAEGDALVEVEGALQRIQAGSYGICELTGKPIPKARLRAVPWTRFAAAAETEMERRGLVTKAHLGELGRVETAPERLSRTFDEIQPPEQEASPASLKELAESATARAEELAAEQPEPDAEEGET